MLDIFVVGLEPFNLHLLRSLPNAERYTFHDLIPFDEAVRPRSGRIDLPALLEGAEKRLAESDERADAIIAYWDFPSTVIAPLLCSRHGLPGARPEAVAACEHKYWCRREQQNAMPDLVPRFCAVDPLVDNPLSDIDLPFPFWIKPIKAHSSYLGFKIRNEADFHDVLPIIQDKINHFGEPFDAFLGMLDVPGHIAGIGGHHCIAEEIISAGRQCTVEGYVYGGEVVVYGVVDSVRSGKHRSSFARYQYPSRLPQRVRDRMTDAVTRFLRHIRYDSAPFNAEFFWDKSADRIRMLEINPRISRSHSPLFLMVDGVSNQQVAIDLALGRRPDLPHRQGRYRLAGKFMPRMFEDGIVQRIPHAENLEQMQRRFPEVRLRLLVNEGIRLSELPYEDSYSFQIAEVFLGADSQSELLDKYRAAQQFLPFRVSPVNAEAG